MSDDIIVAIIGALALVITSLVSAIANYLSAKQKKLPRRKSKR